jgi:hypothetical protein
MGQAVVESGSGICVAPGDHEALFTAVIGYLDNKDRRLSDGLKRVFMRKKLLRYAL